MKYNYLTRRGSAVWNKIALAFIMIIEINLIISTVKSEYFLLTFFVILSILFFLFLSEKFSIVKYNLHQIVIEKIRGDVTYSRNDVSRIEAVKDFLNIYVIKFKDGESYTFGTGGRIGFANDSKKSAIKMLMEIQTDYTYLGKIESIMKDFENVHPEELLHLKEILETTVSTTESLLRTTHFLLAMKFKVNADVWEKILGLKEYCNSIGLLVVVNPDILSL